MKFVAKSLYGLEKVLSEELIGLGAKNVREANRAVLFEGDMRLLYQVNYSIRTALSILMPVGDFRIRSKDDLYKGAMKIAWENYLDPEDTFAVVPVVNSPHFGHTGYAGLLLKDAIADYFRKKTGRRPSVNTCDPRLIMNLHISNEVADISIDSSGLPLFKRGYRQAHSVAPLNEVLAAGILLISGWNAASTLTDPMCGSGTFPIESAMIACNIPPGRYRNSFGFQYWRDFDEALFENVKAECESNTRPSPVKIYGSDISEKAMEQANTNVSKAGLNDVISLEIADFKNTKSRDLNGSVFLNPPYGQRLMPDETDKLYSMIGSTLKHNFPDTNAWLLTSNRESLKHIGLKPKEKHTLYNGALECLLLKYEMYQGTRKLPKV